MLFRQLFEPQSSTYTYLVACEQSGETALIDPVRRSTRPCTTKILNLPGDMLVHPGHDYNQRRVSSVEQERARNPQLAGQDHRRIHHDHGKP